MHQLIAVLIIGVGMGWLVGLSASPIIGAVITSLLGIAGGVVTGIYVTRQTPAAAEGSADSQRRLDAWPAAVFVLGIALAAPLGIMARDYKIFAPEQSAQEISTQEASQAQSPRPPPGSLFSETIAYCDKLTGLIDHPNPSAFRALLASTGPLGSTLEAQIGDDEQLKRITVQLCEATK